MIGNAGGRPTYDAIVVGARVAGSVTAKLLADRGFRVLLVDRATFPSDTLSTHVFSQASLLVLEQAGLLEAAHSVGAAPLLGLRRRLPNSTIFSYFPLVGRYDYALCTRRILLDEALLRAAARHPGIEVLEGVAIEELLWDGARVVGVAGHRRGSSRTAFEARARIVIGADGRRSLVADRSGARAYNVNGPNTCAFYSYWTDIGSLEEDHLESYDFGELPGTIIGCVGDSDIWMMCAFLPQQMFQDWVGRQESLYDERLRVEPGLHGRMGGARRIAPVRGAGDLVNFFRVPWGPGWALVGDAGQHKDPNAGQGIGDALRSASYLVEALDRTWRGLVDEDAALAEYHARRDWDLLPTYERATRSHPPGVARGDYLDYLRLVGWDPQLALAYVGVYVNAVSARAVYAPDLVRQLLSERRRELEERGPDPFGSYPFAPVRSTIPISDDGRPATLTTPATDGTVMLERPARRPSDALAERPALVASRARREREGHHSAEAAAAGLYTAEERQR